MSRADIFILHLKSCRIIARILFRAYKYDKMEFDQNEYIVMNFDAGYIFETKWINGLIVLKVKNK